MIRYRYFIQKTAERSLDYTVLRKFQCLRVPEGDVRIPQLIKTYDPLGWNVPIQYMFPPTADEETYKLQMHFQAYQWHDVFEIQDIDKK